MLHIGHRLWNQKELLAVRVNLGNTSYQYMWNGTQRAVQYVALHPLNLQFLLYNSREHCLRGTSHKLQLIYS
jgi:hypothetical protein